MCDVFPSITAKAGANAAGGAGGGAGGAATVLQALLSPGSAGLPGAVAALLRDTVARVGGAGRALLRQHKAHHYGLSAVWGVVSGAGGLGGVAVVMVQRAGWAGGKALQGRAFRRTGVCALYAGEAARMQNAR